MRFRSVDSVVIPYSTMLSVDPLKIEVLLVIANRKYIYNYRENTIDLKTIKNFNIQGVSSKRGHQYKSMFSLENY